MSIAYVLFAIFCIGYGAQCLRVAWLQWRGDATAGIPRYRGVSIDVSNPSVRGLYRARLPMAVCSFSMAAMVPCVLLLHPGAGKHSVWMDILAVSGICALATMVLSGVCLYLVQSFGWPRFLVPPVLRSE